MIVLKFLELSHVPLSDERNLGRRGNAVNRESYPMDPEKK